MVATVPVVIAGVSAFRQYAQEITLEALVALANEQLGMISPRYRLARGDALSLHVADMDMGGEVRASRSLSGGERFLVSLGLALALSGLEGRQGSCDVLLIDEGFGSLDSREPGRGRRGAGDAPGLRPQGGRGHPRRRHGGAHPDPGQGHQARRRAKRGERRSRMMVRAFTADPCAFDRAPAPISCEVAIRVWPPRPART